MKTSLATGDLVSTVLDQTGMSQTELAAALNTTQAAVSQWVGGRRTPNPVAMRSLERARDAVDLPILRSEQGLWKGPVRVPARLWEPAFRPRGRFRLPIMIEWSGAATRRWRDARDIDSLLGAYVTVMVDGRAADIVRWIDPEILARHADRVLWPRMYAQVWRSALRAWAT